MEVVLGHEYARSFRRGCVEIWDKCKGRREELLNGMEMTGIMQQRSQVGRVERKIVDTDFRISGELPLGTTVRISTLQIYLDVGELYVQVIYAVCMYVDNICLERNARISHGLLGTKSEWETMTMTNEKKGGEN